MTDDRPCVRLTGGFAFMCPLCVEAFHTHSLHQRTGDSLTSQDPSSAPDRRDGGGEDEHWVPVATAPDQLTAEMWQQVLLQEGIPSMLDPHDAISFLGVASTPVRLMVPEGMVAEAGEALAGISGEPFLPEGDGA